MTAVVLGVRLTIVANVAIGQEVPKFQLFSAMVVVLGARRTTAANAGDGVLDTPWLIILSDKSSIYNSIR